MQKQDEYQYPNVGLKSAVSPDGKFVTVTFPEDFIGASVAFIADSYGRHRILLDPLRGGKEVTGQVANDGTKHGTVILTASEALVSNPVPERSMTWWAKQRDTDLLIGQLLTGLCEAPRELERDEPALTIEGALTFVNRWASDNGATLIVEDNTLCAEIRKRWEGKRT